MNLEPIERDDFMSRCALTIAYDGPALQDKTMNIKELAPALLSIGNVLEEANKELNGKDSGMQVLVRSDFKTGSFQVDLEIVRSLGEQISILMGSIKQFSAEDILKTIGFAADLKTLGAVTLIGLIKYIRGRKVKKGTAIENNNVRIEIDDVRDNAIDISKEVYQLYVNIEIHNGLSGALKPLEKQGIDSFYSKTRDREGVRITSQDVSFFQTPKVAELDEIIINEYTNNAVYYIITASFEEGYKWRLSNGVDKITATLKDENFINDLNKGNISLSKDDKLFVKIKTSQWQMKDGLIRTEKEIIEVMEHIKKQRQLQIPFVDIDLNTEKAPEE